MTEAIAILRKAGVKRALISSSGDDGQQRLFQAAPDLVIPELRLYRSRGEIGTWFRDETVISYLEERLRNTDTSGSASSTSTAPTPTCRCRGAWFSSRENTTCSCTRTPTSMRSSACSSSGRRRASSGRTPASSAPSAWPRCCASTRTSGPTSPSAPTTPRATRSIRLARGIPAVSRPLHGRQRQLHPRALALHPGARRVVAALARRPAARRGRAHRMEKRRRDLRLAAAAAG